ncbi:MAG: hypothetical protein Q8M98_10595 [Candidatus Cloacimonadaceae bacterium]|nr:hypothetical protein [Candidatus Cloacimonadaceae bacterium]
MIEQYVEYAYNEYNNNPCTSCDITCSNECVKCLENMNYRKNASLRRYDCHRLCSSYICHYIYKSATEISNILTKAKFLWSKEKILFVAIGCGPCSELFSIDDAITKKNYVGDVRFFGVELNKHWKPFADNCTQFLNNAIQTQIIYQDMFRVLEGFKEKNQMLIPDVIILNYVLSDFHQHEKSNIRKFLRNLYRYYIEPMDNDSYIFINDINHYSIRQYFDELLELIIKDFPKSVCSRLRYIEPHRVPDIPKYKTIPNGNIVFNMSTIQGISKDFSSRDKCSSASMVIRKVNNDN